MHVLRSTYAGTWYPDNPSILSKQLDGYFSNIPVFPQESWKAIIAPHAGMVYSGHTAAYAYNRIIHQVKPNDIIILLAPSHRVFIKNAVTIHQEMKIRTPLGDLINAHQLASGLNKDIFEDAPQIVGQEHAVELHLPFIRYICQRDQSILPVVLGQPNQDNLSRISQNLIQSMDNIVQEKPDTQFHIIASSDLSHFHPSQEAEALDKQVLSYIQRSLDNHNPNTFYEASSNHKIEACGSVPITTVIDLLLERYPEKQKNLKAVEFYRTHSGVISGDYQSVVGYLAAGITDK